MLLLATCSVVLQFIVTTECVKNPRSVHVALETALTFNNKDNSANVKFIDDFQNFLSKVRKTVSNKDTPSRRSLRNYEPPEEDQRATASSYISNIKFTEFIKELIDVLKNYKNEDLEDVFTVIDNEIRKYHYKGCKFYELVSDDNMRRLIADKLDTVKEKPAKYIRKKLDDTLQLIEDAKFDPKKSELLDYIDSLYTRSDIRKFQKILVYFQIYQSKSKRANMDLISLVRDTIRNLIFDHYSNLNVNTRRDFSAKLETYFWRNLRENDDVQHLEWTIQYNKVTKKEAQNLREIQPTASKVTDKELTSNKRDANKPKNTVNLNLEMENQIDIVQSGRISLTKKKNNTQVESEDISANSNYKPETYREGHDLDIQNTEQIKSYSREESGTASDEHDISGNNYKTGHTVNKYEDEGSMNGVDVYSAEKFMTKSKRYKKLKYTTPLSIGAYSAEVEEYDEAKGFTDGNIGRSGNKKQSIIMPDLLNHPNSLTPKPKKNKYKIETTLHSRNRMRTLWVESRITKKHHKNTDDDDDVVKATKMPVDLRSQLVNKKSKPQDLKPKKVKKYKPKARNVISTKENFLRTVYKVNDNTKNANTTKDFSLNAYIENLNPDEGQDLKFKLAVPKQNFYNKNSLRTKTNTDDGKPIKTEDDVTSSKPKMKKSLHATIKRGKLSNVSTDEDVSTEFTKRHNTYKKYTRNPISNSKRHQTVENHTEDETYIVSREDVINISKLPKINKKNAKIQPPTTTAEEQNSIETSKEKDFSEEEKIQSTTKRAKGRKETEQSSKKQISTTSKSMEKDLEEEDHGSSDEAIQTTSKITKKGKKHKKITSTTSKQSESNKKSTDDTNESAEKQIIKKKHKRREQPTKRHIHKKKGKNVAKSLEEQHSKSLEKETVNKKFISNEKSKEERKSFAKHKKTIQKSVKDIFISVENKAHQPLKTAAEAKKKVSKEEKSKGQEKIYNNADKLINDSKSEESASQEKLKKTVNTELPIYKPTLTHQIVETSTEEPNSPTETVEISSTTRRTYKAMDIPIKADITGILNNKLFMRALPENYIKPSNETIYTKHNIPSQFRRMNSEENLTNTTRSYLQLIDLLENHTTMTINLNDISETSAIDIKGNNQTNSIYPHPNFWRRSGNKVKKKTTDVIDTTASNSTTTTNREITANNLTTTQTIEQYNDIGLQKTHKKKKKRKRMFTKTTATTEPTTTILTTAESTITVPTTTKPTTTTVTTFLLTTTEATPNKITTIKAPDYRRTNEEIDVPEPTTEVETATKNLKSEHGKEKFEDYFNYDNNTDYDKTTISEIGDDIKEFLDKHDIKLDDKNDTDINLDLEDINALAGPDVAKDVKPDIKVELRDEKARIRLDTDMMKLFGKTYSHITVSTTPWNTLYTDPFEDMNLLGMNIL